MTTSPLANGRKRIAVFTGSLASSYMMSVCLGASDRAVERGYNAISFAGGPVMDANILGRARGKIFEVPDLRLFDGAVIVVGSLTRYLDDAQFTEFIARFGSLPLVSIGRVVPHVPSVVVDNSSGMRDLVAHLITCHGRRRMAFLSGPERHPSSEEKRQAWVETLAAHGLAPDPALVVHAELTRAAGRRSADRLLEGGGAPPDAIVAVNDSMALGLLEGLAARGVRVPEDIVVTGCLGYAEGLFAEPPLTTVKEPTHELGAAAVDALIDLLEGHQPPERIVVRTELEIRRSCGCSVLRGLPAGKPEATMAWSEAPATSAAPLGAALREVGHAVGSGLDPGEIDALACLVDEETDVDALLQHLDEILVPHIKRESVAGWMQALPALQRELTLYFAARGELERARQASVQIERLIVDVVQKTIGYRRFESEKYIAAFRELLFGLNTTFDAAPITRLLMREMALEECYLNIYEDAGDDRLMVRNVFSVRGGQLLDLPEPARRFPSAQLLPENVRPYDRPYALLALPLSFRADPVGFMITDLSNRNGVVYENIQALLSSALKHESQLQELREAEEKFSDIAHSTSDWLWETDAQGRYTYCSGGVANVLGYSAEEMLGRTLFDFLLPTETDYVERVRDSLMPAMRPLANIENVNLHKNGHEVTLLISGKPIIKNGQLVGYRGAFKDTTEVKRQENRIRQLAYSDTLTGLPNRTLFNDRLDMALAAANRDERRFALMFLDLDRFKIVNDTLGHDAGDMLLKTVAQRLSACIRDGDTLARLGGDEFTVILPAIDQSYVAAVARRIIDALVAPMEIKGQRIHVTTSIGIAVYPEDGTTALSLLKNADVAMYRAKEQGKNRYVFHDPDSQR